MLTSNKIDFKVRSTTGQKGHFIMMKAQSAREMVEF